MKSHDDLNDMTRLYTNVIPKGMSYETLIEGYISLYKRLLEDDQIALRIRNKLKYLAEPNYRSGYRLTVRTAIIARLIWKGIIPGGWKRTWLFLTTLPLRHPSKLATVISDWITALSMRDYAERRLASYADGKSSPSADRALPDPARGSYGAIHEL